MEDVFTLWCKVRRSTFFALRILIFAEGTDERARVHRARPQATDNAEHALHTL
jgi:hypothetical protein